MIGSKLNRTAAEQYSKSFATIIIDDFFSKKDGITGQEIISVTPVKQVNFFILKNLFEQWQEETKKFKSPFFDYKASEVSKALKNLVNVLSKNIFIQKEEFMPLLETAILESLELLYDPINYHTSRASRYAASQNLKADVKYFKIYKSLFENIVDTFEQNSSEDPVSRIKVIIDQSEISNSEKEANVTAFNKVFPIGAELENTGSVKTIEDKSVLNNPLRSTVSKENDEDLSLEFQPTEEPEPSIHNKTVTTQRPPDKSKSSTSSLNEKYAEESIQTLNQQYEEKEKKRTIVSQHQEEAVASLASSISINQRYMFVSDLFDGNEVDYNTAVEQIEKSGSFDDSVEILVQNYSRKYKWDMNSDEVKGLLKIIFKRFR